MLGWEERPLKRQPLCSSLETDTHSDRGNRFGQGLLEGRARACAICPPRPLPHTQSLLPSELRPSWEPPATPGWTTPGVRKQPGSSQGASGVERLEREEGNGDTTRPAAAEHHPGGSAAWASPPPCLPLPAPCSREAAPSVLRPAPRPTS